MGRGLISGVIWGAVLSLGAAALLSLGTAMPERPVDASPEQAPASASVPAEEAVGEPATVENVAPSDAIPLPAGSEFNRPPAEVEPAMPSPDSAPETAPQGQSGALAPVQSAPPAFNTASAPRPEASAEIERPTASGATVEAQAPALAGQAQAPVVEGAPAALGQPQVDAEPSAQTAPAPALASEPAPDSSAEQPSRLAGLQLAGEGSASLASESEEVFDLSTTAAEEVLPAIEAYSMGFEAQGERPLMAVVLIDDPSFPLGRSALTRFEFPVTFAIDPSRADAAEAAQEYRAAGFEVMLLATAFDGADADQAQALWAEGLEVLPEVVAVLDTDQGALQRNRLALETVVEAMAQSGHGLVAFPRGLNVAEQTAIRASVPAATLFREIDGERERATTITRYLDRAAFAAGQEGQVIVVGHTYSDTVTALFSWALGGRSEGVALAPVSAVLRR